jgi:hypothetical protein
MWLAIFITALLVMPFSPAVAENENIIEHETGFYYTVQKGDTLWDLSRKFSDSAWLWPEMWKENSQIANPHRIYPGERIRLYRRAGYQKISEKKTGVAPPTLENLIHYDFSALDRVGFIRKQPVPPQGAIFKVMETKVMISEDDIVYIRPEGDTKLVPGQRYTIYRTLKPIRERSDNTYIGIQHLLTGVVEITQVQPDYAIGTVIKSYRPIHLEDKLMPYYRRIPEITLKESPRGLEGKIIEAEDHNRIIGISMIAFIDKGKKDGVHPGQFYNVFQQAAEYLSPKKQGKVELLPVDIAEMLVVHTEDTTATVIITRADKEFEAHSKIRSPVQ